MDNSLNTMHISDNNYRDYEAARTAFFVLLVDDLDGKLLKPEYKGDPARASESDYLKTPQEALKLNVVSCPVPHFEVSTMEYRRGNDVVKFAGVPTWTGGTIKVDDVVGIDTKSILLAWQYLAYNPHTRKGGRMKDYKKTATLCEYTQDYELIRSWKLEGVFITKISEDEFNRENDGKRQLSVDFSFDRAIVEVDEVE